MLNVTFACGATTRVPYNPAQTVDGLLESVRSHEKAAMPAPGRERAYLVAAVNSSPLAAAKAADESPAASQTRATAEPRSTLLGKAFVPDAPFPPRQLVQGATLADSGVKPDGTVYAVFVAPQIAPDLHVTSCASSSPQAPAMSGFAQAHPGFMQTPFAFGGTSGGFAKTTAKIGI